MVSIETEDERRYIYNEILSWSSHRFYWIGLNDVKQANNYEWVCTIDGELCPQTSFRWWATGMPEQGLDYQIMVISVRPFLLILHFDSPLKLMMTGDAYTLYSV